MSNALHDWGDVAQNALGAVFSAIASDECDGICLIAFCDTGVIGFCAMEPKRKEEMISRLEAVLHNLKTDKIVSMEQVNALQERGNKKPQ
jgi:hypothetical protein